MCDVSRRNERLTSEDKPLLARSTKTNHNRRRFDGLTQELMAFDGGCIFGYHLSHIHIPAIIPVNPKLLSLSLSLSLIRSDYEGPQLPYPFDSWKSRKETESNESEKRPHRLSQ